MLFKFNLHYISQN